MTNTKNTPDDHRTNLIRVIHRAESLPATEAADFQAHMINAAAKIIDPATWERMIIEANQHAKRDPWHA